MNRKILNIRKILKCFIITLNVFKSFLKSEGNKINIRNVARSKIARDKNIH